MIDREHPLPVTAQCQLLQLPQSSAYLALVRQIESLHLEYPLAGSRMLRDMLRQEGTYVGRQYVRTLMRKMGIEVLYRKPNTVRRDNRAGIFPYLLRDLAITGPNHVWPLDLQDEQAGKTEVPHRQPACLRILAAAGFADTLCTAYA